MRLLAIAILLITAACAPLPPQEVGPYIAPKLASVPACSQVTVSQRPGTAHWVECDVR